MIRLRTVDVWDTLLRRRCHPDAVKLHTSNYLLLRWWSDLRPELRDARKLLSLRLDIEHELARASARTLVRDDEYTLREVLSEWIGRSFPAGADAAAILDELEAEEFEQERSVCYADPGIGAVLSKHPAERTLFVSDFYMPAHRIAELLKSEGICLDGGHSSCDHLLNKRSGRLFKALQEQYGVIPSQHFHVGDNTLSDVKVPRRMGMKAAHYRHAAQEHLRQQSARWFRDRAALYKAIRDRCHNEVPDLQSGPAAEAFRFGIELAPLFAAFAQFILEAVRRDGVGQLFFLTREGEFFAQAYDILRDAGGRLRNMTPAAGVLEVSRVATFAASLEDASVDGMMRLWRAYDPQSMSAWSHSLGLEPASIAAWCGKYGLPFEAPLLHPWQDERVVALLRDAQFRQLLQQMIVDKRSLLLAYLKSQGLRDGLGTVAVVDVGWRGTIQDNIALLLPNTRFCGYYLGLQRFLNPQPANCCKSAFGPNLNIAQDGAALFGNLPLIEMLTNSRRGSVAGYDRAPDGTVRIHRQDEAGESSIFVEVVSHVQAGALHGVRIWAEQIHAQALSSTELRGPALKLWARMIARPPRVVSAAYARLRHNELFGRGVFERRQAARPSFADRLRKALG